MANEPTAAELRDALAEMLENLEGYIQREAGKAAAPLIEQAQQEANAAIREAEAEVQRNAGTMREMRRRLAVWDVAQRNERTACTRLAVALNHGPLAPGPLESLVAEVERRLAEDAATIERLRSQVLGATMAGQMEEVRLPEYPEASHA